jgi:hypothetical protein
MEDIDQDDSRIKDPQTLKTAQIGRCGEILVQYRLLMQGIESAPMTTDAGIDLVAYSPRKAGAITIQVKAKHRPTPGGGKGKFALDWWISETSPAEVVAFVDLDAERIWLFRHDELEKIAQQKSSGRLHFYMYVDPEYTPRHAGRHDREYESYLIEKRIEEIFG